MKQLYTVFIGIAIAFAARAQNPVPNPSFENWTGNGPTGWSGSMDITQVAPGHTGTYAAKGEKAVGTYPALMLPATNISQQYAYLNLYYKLNRVSGDYLVIAVNVNNASSVTIGTGVLMVTTPASNFTAFSIPIYYTTGTPHDFSINITMNNDTSPVPHIGSWFILDDIALASTATGITEPATVNFSVSPNPANELLYLQMGENTTGSCSLFNAVGQQVKAFEVSKGETQLDISDLSNGIYVVAVKQDGLISTRKIQIAR